MAFYSKHKNNTMVSLALSTVVVLEVILLIVFCIQLRNNFKYRDHLSLGNKYFNELDYENAELQYLAAIRIDKKEITPYINLSHVYIVTKHYDEAYNILQSAKEHVKEKNQSLIINQEKHLEQITAKSNGSDSTTDSSEDSSITVTFEEFASQYTFFSKEHETGNVKYVLYLTKTDWLKMDSLPIQPLTYTIHDFDKDGKEELFIMDIASDYTMIAKMYEEMNGEVILSSELTLETDLTCEAEEGEMQCIYYEQNDRTILAVAKAYNASHFSDGIFTKFTNFYYDGTNLVSIGSAECAGSSFDPNDNETDKYIALGVPADVHLLENGNFLDYLPSPTVFAGSKTVCYTSYDEVDRFYNSSYDSMDVSYIEFY